MAEYASAKPPQNTNDGLACIVLFTLTKCDGTRQAFKLRNTISKEQIAIAREILEYLELNYTDEEILGLCRFLSYRSNKPSGWINWADPMWHRPADCAICGQKAATCQIPPRYANKIGISNEPQFKADPSTNYFPGVCLRRHIEWAMEIGIFDFPLEMSGWRLIDEYDS
jgi:hypothetical protein